MLAHGELNGVMWIGATPDQILTRRKAGLLGGIANQAAMAIDSAQLAIAQREEAWVSMALLQVAEAIGPLTELDDIVGTIVRLTPLFAGVDMCALFLAEKDRPTLVSSQAHGLPPDLVNEFALLRSARSEWIVDGEDAAHAVLAVPDRVAQALRLSLPIVMPLRGRTELVG